MSASSEEQEKHRYPEGWAHVAHDIVEWTALIVIVLVVAQCHSGRIW